MTRKKPVTRYQGYARLLSLLAVFVLTLGGLNIAQAAQVVFQNWMNIPGNPKLEHRITKVTVGEETVKRGKRIPIDTVIARYPMPEFEYTFSYDYRVEYSGSFGVSIGALEAALGFSLSHGVSESTTKRMPALKANTKMVIYKIPQFTPYHVSETIYTSGWLVQFMDDGTQNEIYINPIPWQTKNFTVYKATFPFIDLVISNLKTPPRPRYPSDPILVPYGTNSRESSDGFSRVIRMEYKNGSYQIVKDSMVPESEARRLRY